jgi:hypothetical protein
MEQKIYETENDFDFTKLSISQPSAIQGGAYVTKIKYDENPLYIQTPKCLTKQGLNETNKKAYIDLMYSSENNTVIEWFENLETALVKLIYDKRELWFQNDMDMEDIENFFNPITRAYKGGKYHLVRVNIPKNKTLSSQYACNVYDETENMVAIQELNDTHNIIPCLEIHSIKFSARNFQVELIGKQIMILNNKPLFTSCMIKRPLPMSQSIHADNVDDTNQMNTHDVPSEVTDDVPSEVTDDVPSEVTDVASLETIKIQLGVDMNKENYLEDVEQKDKIMSSNQTEPPLLKEGSLEDISNDISINTIKSSMTLNNPNDVYYEIYKIAKQKAKEHKKAAITHYLEAKKIKNTYMLDELYNSDELSSDDDIDSDSEEIKNQINEMVEELT